MIEYMIGFAIGVWIMNFIEYHKHKLKLKRKKQSKLLVTDVELNFGPYRTPGKQTEPTPETELEQEWIEHIRNYKKWDKEWDKAYNNDLPMAVFMRRRYSAEHSAEEVMNKLIDAGYTTDQLIKLRGRV